MILARFGESGVEEGGRARATVEVGAYEARRGEKGVPFPLSALQQNLT